MDLTQVELKFLIESATRDRPVQVAFGPGGAWLKDVPVNDWAIKLVTSARAQVEKNKKELEAKNNRN